VPSAPPPRRWQRRLDRAILGALMTVAAVLVERRLRKAFGKAPNDERRERTVEVR